ncbi:MAG TPA: PmoA family protein [Chryseolinea sp.]|nr:PmoA family protein [Chryseolinea sp.]
MSHRRLIVFAILFQCCLIQAFSQKGFSLVEQAAKKKVEILHDGKLLTAYCYFDSTEKPVLFPLKTLSGVTITRGYPIAPREGERTDHPHHVGLWMNYESVNDLDFWNNSTAIAPEKLSHYGSIRHQKIVSTKSNKDMASLETTSHWVNQQGQVLIRETTQFTFTKSGSDFIIDRSSTLEAAVPEVVFKDVKDGMLAIRVSRQLEMPSKEAGSFVDAHGQVTKVPTMDNSNVTGMYFNKEGIKGDSVWGKRSEWACLEGKQDGKLISLVIIDHPENPGYPTYWHARGYGLFAANPLGQKVFSKGKEELNLSMKQGEKIMFRYRIIIHEGSHLKGSEINDRMTLFTKASKNP